MTVTWINLWRWNIKVRTKTECMGCWWQDSSVRYHTEISYGGQDQACETKTIIFRLKTSFHQGHALETKNMLSRPRTWSWDHTPALQNADKILKHKMTPVGERYAKKLIKKCQQTTKWNSFLHVGMHLCHNISYSTICTTYRYSVL